jgi:hypothetical protein
MVGTRRRPRCRAGSAASRLGHRDEGVPSAANHDFKQHELGSLESWICIASVKGKGKAGCARWRSEPRR